MPDFRALLADIAHSHGAAHARAAETASRLLNVRNWLIGAAIVAYEQDGEDRAAYGEALLERLADALAAAGHAGLSSRKPAELPSARPRLPRAGDPARGGRVRPRPSDSADVCQIAP
jgi:hypothetical protein